MIDMSDGPDVHMGFAAIEFLFGHVVCVLYVLSSNVVWRLASRSNSAGHRA
jgi:hypothetical protein